MAKKAPPPPEPRSEGIQKPKKRGRPCAPYSAAQLERLMCSGLDIEAVAKALKISAKTVQRRVAEQRAEHGDAWGRPIPAPRDAAPVVARCTRTPTDVELVELARRTLVDAMEGLGTAEQIAAARTVLDRVTPPPPPPVEQPREDVLARVLAATANADQTVDVPARERRALGVVRGGA